MRVLTRGRRLASRYALRVVQDPEQLFSASLAKALADAAKTQKVFDSAAEKLVADAQAWGKQVAAITNSVATAAIAQANVAQQLNQMLRPIQEALNQAYANLDLSWVAEALKAGMPPNWQDFDSGEVDRILTVMDETGWCLVWSPRADVIRVLIEATDMDARHEVLLEMKGDVVEDLIDCLEGVTHEDSKEYRRADDQAVQAFAAGHVEAAQALAASVISAIINGGFRMPSFAEARERFKGDPKEASIRAFREQAVYNMVADCLQRFFVDRGDPVPPNFSRHATAHSVAAQQYNEVNSLASLLLAVAFTKEADVLMHDAETPGAA